MHPSYIDFSIDQLMNEDLWDIEDSIQFTESFTADSCIDDPEAFEDDQLSPAEPLPDGEPFDWFHELGKEYDV